MKKKILTNFLYQASYQLLLILLPIITIPVVSRALGPDGIGTYNYINSITAYFILFAGLGLSNYGVREIAIVRNDPYKRSKKFWELEFFNIFFTLVAVLSYMIFIMSINENERVLYLVQGAAVLSNLFDITWFFSGIEDFKKITIRNFIVKLTTFILIVFFIKEKEDLLLYFLIQSFGILFSQMSMWLSISKHISFCKVTIKDIFSHLKPCIEFFVAKVAMSLYQNTTKTVLGIMTSMTVVGYYSNSLTLVVVSGSIVNAMNTVMIPRMSNMFGNNEEDGMVKLLQKMIHMQLFFTIAICFGIIAINEKMIPWFFGNEFTPIKNIVPLLAPVIIPQSLQMAIAAQYLIPKKEMKEYNLSVVLGAAVSVLITVSLVPLLEVYGAVIGIFMGYCTICALRIKALVSNTKFRFEGVKIMKYFFSAFIMCFLVYTLTNNMESTFITTIIQVIFGGGVYMLTTLLLKVNPLTSLLSKKN